MTLGGHIPTLKPRINSKVVAVAVDKGTIKWARSLNKEVEEQLDVRSSPNVVCLGSTVQVVLTDIYLVRKNPISYQLKIEKPDLVPPLKQNVKRETICSPFDRHC